LLLETAAGREAISFVPIALVDTWFVDGVRTSKPHTFLKENSEEALLSKISLFFVHFAVVECDPFLLIMVHIRISFLIWVFPSCLSSSIYKTKHICSETKPATSGFFPIQSLFQSFLG
jgi:hypothetical protein